MGTASTPMDEDSKFEGFSQDILSPVQRQSQGLESDSTTQARHSPDVQGRSHMPQGGSTRQTKPKILLSQRPHVEDENTDYHHLSMILEDEDIAGHDREPSTPERSSRDVTEAPCLAQGLPPPLPGKIKMTTSAPVYDNLLREREIMTNVVKMMHEMEVRLHDVIATERMDVMVMAKETFSEEVEPVAQGVRNLANDVRRSEVETDKWSDFVEKEIDQTKQKYQTMFDKVVRLENCLAENMQERNVLEEQVNSLKQKVAKLESGVPGRHEGHDYIGQAQSGQTQSFAPLGQTKGHAHQGQARGQSFIGQDSELGHTGEGSGNIRRSEVNAVLDAELSIRRNDRSFLDPSQPYFKPMPTNLKLKNHTYRPFDAKNTSWAEHTRDFEAFAAANNYTEGDCAFQLYETTLKHYSHVISNVPYFDAPYKEVKRSLGLRMDSLMPRSTKELQFKKLQREKSEGMGSFVHRVYKTARLTYPELVGTVEPFWDKVNEKVAESASTHGQFRQWYLQRNPQNISVAVDVACRLEGIVLRERVYHVPNENREEVEKPPAQSASSNQDQKTTKQNSREWGNNTRPKYCYGCKEQGHWKSDCPHSSCFGCGKKGHTLIKCPEIMCAICKEKGHFVAKCPKGVGQTMPKTSQEN